MASGSAADPFNFEPAATEIPTATQKRAKAAVVAAAMSLEHGEQVRAMVCGEYLAHDGVAVLTDRRVVFANARTFAPDVHAAALNTLTEVKGWAEKGRATLRIASATTSFVIGDIKEVDAAQGFAAAVRSNL